MHRTAKYLLTSLTRNSQRHRDVFSRNDLPIARVQPLMSAHGFRFNLWISARDLAYIEQCDKLRRAVGTTKLNDRSAKPFLIASSSYFNLSQFKYPKNFLAYAKKAQHANLITGKRFAVQVQILLTEHANVYDLISSLWFTSSFLDDALCKSVKLLDNAVPVEIPQVDLKNSPGDEYALSFEERMQAGVVRFYNASQTTNPDAVADLGKRGAMRCIHTGERFRPRVQHYLFVRAKLLGFKSRYWLSTTHLRKEYPGLLPLKGTRPLGICTSQDAPRTYVFNIEQLEKGPAHDKLLRRAYAKGFCSRDFSDGFPKNIFGGFYRIPAISDALHRFAKARGFHSLLWLDSHQIDMLKDTFTLKQNECGITIESRRHDAAKTLFNIEQMENHDHVKAFVDKLTPEEVSDILRRHHACIEEIPTDEFGF